MQRDSAAAVKLAIEPDLERNLERMEGVFQDCSDVVFRHIRFEDDGEGLLIFIDGIVKSEDVADQAIRPLFRLAGRRTDPEALEQETLTVPQLSETRTYEEAADAILSGNALLFVDGYGSGIIINARGGTRRGVEEPQTESVVRGPREGYNENLRTNTGLLRFKIKSSSLRMVPFQIGTHTKTNVVLSYLDGIADPEVIAEVRNRLERVKIDGVLESGYIEELIEDQPLSPFPQMQYTERPDTTAAQLLEGKFAIFIDGTPFVIMGPVTFWLFMQASEDYYERYFVGNMIRLLRYLFFFIALFLPALYVAITTYHQDMLPTNLLLSIATARESIPFPALVEALIMEISFEALREAGIRLPKTVGQAVSILGALVIGQSAVQAGIVSAPMVIIVSLTGIASFTIPRFNMAISVRILRFPLMIMAGVLGLFGIVIGTVWIVTHMCQLRSFGVPYMSGVAPYSKQEQKDIFVRAPWWRMWNRPEAYSHRNRSRMKQGMMPGPEHPKG